MAMLGRLRWLVVATVLGSLIGFLGSYLFVPRYIASAVLQVDDVSWQCRGCRLPDKSYVQHKLANYLQQVFSLKNLRPLMEREQIARPEDAEEVYREIHWKMTLRVGGDSVSPDIDLIYMDSTPQRAEEFCSLLTSAIQEKTKADEQAAFFRSFNAGRSPSGAISISILGQGPQPYSVWVALPCTSGTRDFSHSILCAAIGSAGGLFYPAHIPHPAWGERL